MQTSHRGWSTSQKYVQNPLVSSQTFFVCQPNFFCPIYCLCLMSNKNLIFFSFKHHVGGGLPFKNLDKILQSLLNIFYLLVVFFFRFIPSQVRTFLAARDICDFERKQKQNHLVLHRFRLCALDPSKYLTMKSLVLFLISNLTNELLLHQFLMSKPTVVNKSLKSDANRAHQ